MRAAVERGGARQGAVGVLVNNAGYSQGGAIERSRWRPCDRQFETNVFGLIALTQMVLRRDARPALGQDRQHRLDGWPADVPRRGPLPRHQVLVGGHQRRAALRGARLRSGRRADRARADRDRVRGHRRGQGERGRRRRHRWSVCRVRREGLGAHHGRLRRPDAPPRRRPGCRRESDREGDLPPPRAVASAGDGVGAPVDLAAQAHPGSYLGRGDAIPVPPAQVAVLIYAASGTTGSGRPTWNPWA